MSEFIRKYCLDRFRGNYRLMSDDTELVVPSIYVENDHKMHQSINLDNGLWRCFKSGETGNFLKLYSKLEKCSYQEAYERLVFEDFVDKGTFKVPKKIEPLNPDNIADYLEETENFKEINGSAPHEQFVKNRLLEGAHDFFIAKGGRYDNRLIIPFFNRKGKMFYFQGRAVDDRQPKYLNCKNVRSSQILLPFDYDSYEPLYITEGVFDALAIRAVGFNATTTLSCHTSKEQMLQLSQYRGPLVCAFDGDEAGLDGMRSFIRVAYWAEREDLMLVSVPKPSKDWNEVLIEQGPDKLIEALTEPLTLNLTTLEYLKLTV